MRELRVTTSKNAAQQIGQHIHDLRKQRRLTGEELAQQAGVSQSRVSKIENGYSDSFEPEQVKNILNILKAPKTIRQQVDLLMLQRIANETASQFIYPFQFTDDIAELDARTSVYRTYLVWALSAVMQTAEYRKAILKKLGLPEAEIPIEITRTMARQDLVWNKTFYFVMPEAILYTAPAGREAQLAQLDRLERMIGLGRVKVGIIPLEMGLSVFETGTFTVCDDHTVELYLGDRIVRFEEPDMLLNFSRAFTELEQKAVYDEEAIALIRKAMDHFRV